MNLTQLLGVIFLPAVALAQGTNADADVSQLYTFISGFYNRLLLPIGVVLAGLVIMYGGIVYATSGGDASKAQKAKEYIYGAISGLVLLILAALIVQTITQ